MVYSDISLLIKSPIKITFITVIKFISIIITKQKLMNSKDTFQLFVELAKNLQNPHVAGGFLSGDINTNFPDKLNNARSICSRLNIFFNDNNFLEVETPKYFSTVGIMH